MRFSGINYRRLTNVLSTVVLSLFVLPVMAEEADRSMEEFTQATQIWGQAFIAGHAAQQQRVLAMEITLDYENQLAQEASEAMDEANLETIIEAVTPDIVSGPSDAVAIERITCKPGKAQC